jgi:hypothetical protein
MSKLRSKDGTEIAYTRDGNGPVVVLVSGGLDDGSENATLVPAMAGTFTVINYARRAAGRAATSRRTRWIARSRIWPPLWRK